MEGKKNYYAVLEVEESADQQAIKKAYYKLALVWHPDKSASKEKATAEEKFKEINEAYEVLGNINTRADYDLSRRKHQPFDFPPSNPREVFKSFTESATLAGLGLGAVAGFGTGTVLGEMIGKVCGLDPVASAEFGGLVGGGLGAGLGAHYGNQLGARLDRLSVEKRRALRNPASVFNYPLELTLEEINSGLTKTLRITRTLLDGKEEILEHKLNIHAGCPNNFAFIAEGCGDETLTGFGDIKIFIVQKEHKDFVREGANLIYTYFMEDEVLPASSEISVPQIGNGPKKLRLRDDMASGDCGSLWGAGLPDGSTFGNLVIQFKKTP